MKRSISVRKLGAWSVSAVVGVALLGPGCGDDTSATGGAGGGGTTTTGGTGQGGIPSTGGGGQAGGLQGGGGQGGGQGGGPTCENLQPLPVAGDTCDAVAEGFCATWEACNPFLIGILSGTKAECLLLMHATCVQNILQPGDQHQASDYENCGELGANALCGCAYDCEVIAPGTQAVDDPCMDDAQCASGACFGRKEYVECGVCYAAGALGDACDGLQVRCNEGLYCDEPNTGNCETQKIAGAACVFKDECADGSCYDGLCTAPLSTGDDCSGTGGDEACDLFGQGEWCGPVSQVCEPFPLAELGDPCGMLAGGEVGFCEGNLRCSASPMGSCVARDDLGDPCTAIGSDPGPGTCLPHLHCIGGNCAVPTPLVCQ